MVDPAAARRLLRITATILPQVISLRPKEQIRHFSTMVLDRRGNLISHGDARWEVLDGRAGVITQRGHFTAGEEPRVYPAAIGVSTRVEGLDEDVRATATVIVVDVTPIQEAPGQNSWPE